MNSLKNKIKLIIFSILPTIFIFGMAEFSVRFFSLDQPSLIAGGSGIGPNSIVQTDIDLGWALKPNKRIGDKNTVTTNSLGLRSPEIFPEKKNEFRILSLGESTTFGIGVSDSETYSAKLQEILNKKNITSNKVTVINAGISAYSSFQSLKYLELKGIKLKPDLILFYNELNDYLPTNVRDINLNEVGILKTDKQLYDSRLVKFNRALNQKSAFYRFISYNFAKYKINKMNQKDIENPILNIGMPDSHVSYRIYKHTKQGIKIDSKLNPMSFGRRVSENERIENLSRLFSLCNKKNIRLIIIHPSYSLSTLHECVLTQFCRKNNVLMFEAYHSLHPENLPTDVIFLDLWHPTPLGHECLAVNLAQFIHDNIFSNEAQ
ncbi:hypothetical protein QUF75_01615 [Desulfococcaceae bacterium HSG7]|nr:hypothetical protein [Desulfococcaceae bacterium HSG7]